MGSLQKFKIGGIDLKSNDLVRDPMMSSYLRNTIKTETGDISGRNGYEDQETSAFELEESVYHKSTNSDIFIRSDGSLYKIYNGARMACSIASLFPNVGLALKNRIITDEYLSNMYLTTNDGKSRVVKFDGSDAYLAGMPAPMLKAANDATTKSDVSSSGDGYYYRFFYGHKDINGNLTYGPYRELTSSSATATVTTSTFKTNNYYGDFFNKYLIVPALTIVTVDGSVPGTSNRIPYSSTNYAVGDKFLVDDELLFLYGLVITGSDIRERQFKAITITAKSGTHLTLDIAEFTNFSFSISTTPALNIDSRCRLYVFISNNQSFGYIPYVPTSDVLAFVIDNSQDSLVANGGANSLIFLEDIYNEAEQKLPPPKCKYLTAYGDQLIYGNIIGVWDQENKFTQYNNDDLIIPSDFGIGDNGENHSAHIQRIGESYDGSVNGLKRCNDLLVTVKDNAIYALDGIIEPGGYTLRKIPTDYIGCLNHNSIVQVKGGIFFQGNDGMYFTNGSSCNKVSEDIDPFFNDINSLLTKCTVSRKFKSFLFYMTNGTTHFCLVFMYEFKEWFIWDSLNMSKGIYEKNNGDVVFANANVLYRFNQSYSDDGVAISHIQASNWEDLRNPSINKKFKFLRLFNLNSVPTSYKIRVQKDWVDTDLEDVDVVIPARGSVQKGFDQRNCKSIRFIFQNTVVNENMLITGYELEYEATQKLDKGGPVGTS